MASISFILISASLSRAVQHAFLENSAADSRSHSFLLGTGKMEAKGEVAAGKGRGDEGKYVSFDDYRGLKGDILVKGSNDRLHTNRIESIDLMRLQQALILPTTGLVAMDVSFLKYESRKSHMALDTSLMELGATALGLGLLIATIILVLVAAVFKCW